MATTGFMSLRCDGHAFTEQYQSQHGPLSPEQGYGLRMAYTLLHDLRTLIYADGRWQHDHHDADALTALPDGRGWIVRDRTVLLPQYGATATTLGGRVGFHAQLTTGGDDHGACRLTLVEAAPRGQQHFVGLRNRAEDSPLCHTFAFNAASVRDPLQVKVDRSSLGHFVHNVGHVLGRYDS